MAKATALLTTGNAIAYLASLLVAPVLSRLYAPEDFGVLSVFTGIIGVLGVVAAGRYELAIPLAYRDGQEGHVLRLAAYITAGSSLVVLASALIFRGALGGLVGDANQLLLVVLLPVGMGLGALVTAMRYWHNSAGSFSTVARATGGQAVARASGQAAMGLSGLGSGGLVLGHVGGQLIALLTLIRAGLPKNSRGRTLEVARRYRRFPMLSAPGSLLTSVGLHGPPVVYAAYFGLVVSGLYGFAMAVLGLPTALLSQSISQVFYPTAARQEADPVQARRLIDQVTGVLLSIAIPVFGTLAVSGPWLFTAIFGSGWEAAGRYAQLLAPWLAVRFVVSPVSTYLFVVEQQDVALRISVIEAALRVAAVAIGIATASPELAIGLYSLASLGALIEWLRRVLLEVQSSVHQWMQQRAQPLIGTALVIVSGILLSRTSDVVGLLATVVSLTAIGLWIVWPYRQDLTGAASPGNVDGPSAP